MSDEPITPTGADLNPGGDTPAPSTVDSGKLTQAEVDDRIKDRLARERTIFESKQAAAIADGIQAWREEQGIDDDLLARLDTQREQQDETSKELRALKGLKTKLDREHEALKTKHGDVSKRLHGVLTRDAVYREAATVSVDPEQVWMNLRTRLRVNEDHEVEVLDERGEVSTGDIKTMVTNLLSEKPFLAKPTSISAGAGSRGTAAAGGQGNSQPDFTKKADRLAYLRANLTPR